MTITTPARKSGSVAVARIKETVTKRGTPARQGDALAAHLLTMQLALSPEHIEKPFALPQLAACQRAADFPQCRGITVKKHDANRIYGGRHRHGTIARQRRSGSAACFGIAGAPVGDHVKRSAVARMLRRISVLFTQSSTTY